MSDITVPPGLRSHQTDSLHTREHLLTSLPVSIRDIWAAKLRISSLIWRTSLLPTATLSRMTGTNLRIKTENL